jgi:hypothetical protein
MLTERERLMLRAFESIAQVQIDGNRYTQCPCCCKVENHEENCELYLLILALRQKGGVT